MHIVKQLIHEQSQRIGLAGICTREPWTRHVSYHSWLAYDVRIGKDPEGLIYSSNCPFLPSFRFILKNFNLILNVHVASRGI